MSVRLIAALLLLAISNQCHAQEHDEFATLLRTKDSMMHIAFYDKDYSNYKKYFAECLAGYNKLNAKDKEAYKADIEDQYYYLACAYALSGDKANAMLNLEKANMYDYDQLQHDNNLDVLRKDPRFMQYMAKVKNKKSKYTELLQKEAKYNAAEQSTLPAFTYQSADDASLVALKNSFNLDSVAGQGNDVSRIINLMKWVHYMVPHNGSKGNPKVKNAMSFITECRRDGKSLNCRGLGIALNDVYLAAGFKSRFVTCLPKDTTDNDCHVITMVWSKSLNKWLWMDPTFMAYVMNEQGTPLSVEEVRERLAANKPLILNPDANRNHAVTQTKDDYLGYYMSKNLYKLECPVDSRYDYETYAEGKTRSYIQLLPGSTALQPRIAKNDHGVATFSLYYTNNAKAFWAAPVSTVAGATAKTNSGHKQSDYEVWMAKFRNAYNQQNTDDVVAICEDDFRTFWSKDRAAELVKEYGAINSCQFIGMEKDNWSEDVALFRMVFERSTHCMAISLDEYNKANTFRFQTRSNYIDWAMAKAGDKEKVTK